MCCSPLPALRSPGCALSPRRSCRPSTRSRLSPKFSVSLEAGGDAADQVLAVERPEIELYFTERRLERANKLREFAFSFPAHFFGSFELDRNETQWIAGTASSELRQVGGNHGGNFRVAAGRLVIGEKHDRLARAGYLNGAGGDRVGDNVPTAAVRQHRAIQAHPHAVRIIRYTEFGAEQRRQRLRSEIILLRPEDDAGRLVRRCGGRRGRAQLGPLRGARNSEGYQILGLQGTPVQPAECRPYVSRSAAVDMRHRYPTLDGEIAARGLAAGRNLHDVAPLHCHALPRRH